MTEVLINKENSTIILTLNRERVLNALNLNMVRIISENISSWNDDDSISGVLLRGAGEKAFCAGGDIVSVYHSKNDEGNNLSYDFFKEEYLLNYEISKFKKPWISLLNGIAMGGGLGLSVHGSHRIVSEKTVTAMPETAIGLFPDVGGGYFLSRVDHFVGTYLALTGKTLDGDNSIFAKIGTHIIENNLVDECVKKILNLKKYTKYDIDNILNKPVEEVIIAGSIKPHQVNSFFEQEISLEPLASGGIFKMTRAPSKPGIQIWSGIIAHPEGMITFTKSIDIVDKI